MIYIDKQTYKRKNLEMVSLGNVLCKFVLWQGSG